MVCIIAINRFSLALPCYSCEDEYYGYAYLNAYGVNSIPPITGCYMGEADLIDASRWGLPPDSGLNIANCGSYTIKLSTADGEQESAALLTSVEPSTSTNFVAQVYDQNNQLVPNVAVQLTLKVKQDSGGHHHGNDTVAARTGTLAGQQVLTGNTGPNGQGFSFAYNAPDVSGDIDILATCTGGKNCTPQGPDTVWVGYKGLQPLNDNSVYILLPNNNDLQHPDNHNLTLTAASRMAIFATLYHGKYPNLSVLQLNDASLERGGIFDLGHNWKSPHYEHCGGAAIDIRANGGNGALNITGDGVTTTDDGTVHPKDPMINQVQRIARIVGVEAKWEVPEDSNGNPAWASRHFHTRLMGQEGLTCP